MPSTRFPFRNAIAATSLFCYVFLAVAVYGQSRSGIPGPKGKLHTSIPSVVTDTLANGLRYYFTRVNDLPVAEFNVIVDAGISTELKGETGFAFITAQLLLSGSEKRTKGMIDDFLHEQASVVVPYAHYDYAQLYVKTLSRNFSASMDVVADAVTRPKFPEQELARFTAQAATDLPDQRMSGGERASHEMINILCGQGHVLTRRPQPTQSDLIPVTREKLREFHARCYSPERATVIVTGDLDPSFVRTVLQEQFGSWKRSRHPVVSPEPPAPSGYTHLVVDDSATARQLAYYRIGMPALLQNDPRFPALVALNSLLSDGTGSRLRSALWGRHTVAPSFKSSIGFSRDCSYLLIAGSTSPFLADSVILYVQDELEALATKGISKKELDDVLTELLRDNALLFSSNRNVQSLLKEMVVYGGTAASVFSFPDRLAALTVAEVNALAKELFQKNKIHVVVYGNASKLLTPLTTVLGAVPVVSTHE